MALTRRRPSPRVVIIGAGFGGLAAAVALRRKGIDDLTIIDHIDLVKRGRVRRAKLYYLRGLTGKAAKIKERR